MDNEQEDIKKIFEGKLELTSLEIAKEIQIVEDILIEKMVWLIKGFHDRRNDKGLGMEHIKIHMENNAVGKITMNELVNLGNSLRKYLKIFKTPFIDKKQKYPNSTTYEWQDDNNVRFRCIVDHIEREVYKRGGPQLSLPPSRDTIITFYSDRNLNEKMIFKNPKVEEYYSNLDIESVIKDR